MEYHDFSVSCLNHERVTRTPSTAKDLIALLSNTSCVPSLLHFSLQFVNCLISNKWNQNILNKGYINFDRNISLFSHSSHLEDIFCAVWVCLVDRGRGATHLCWLSSLDKPFPPQNVTRWSPFFSQEPPNTALLQAGQGAWQVWRRVMSWRERGGGGWTWPRWRGRGFGWETWWGGVNGQYNSRTISALSLNILIRLVVL